MPADLTKKDYVKAARLQEVYDHLCNYYQVKSKTDFAQKIERSRPELSCAFGGTAAYLTKGLFMKICKHYPATFEMKYLLTGEGELLTKAEKERMKRVEMVNAEKLAHADVLDVAPVKDQKSDRYIRLLRVLHWLKAEKQINQKDIANIMGVNQNTITRGIKRVEINEGFDFLIKFQKAFNYLSLDWLLDGMGDMLLPPDGTPSKAQPTDQVAVAITLLARQNETLTQAVLTLTHELHTLRDAIKNRQ